MPLTTIKSSNIKDAEVKNADISPTAGIAESKVAGLDAAQISTNAFNIGVLGFKMAVSEGLTVFNLIDGIVDEFNNESGIDTSENATSKYDASSDFYSNLDGPNPIPSPQATLTRLTSTGPGTFSNEPTTTEVKVFAIGGGGAGGGGGLGSGGGAGGDTDNDILKNVRIGIYDFSAKEWESISADAKDFIRKLLTRDPKERMTTRQALSHGWLTTKSRPQRQVSTGYIKNLRNYRRFALAKKAALIAMAFELTQDEIVKSRETFQAIDTEGNGFITSNELKSVLNDLTTSGGL